jgi:hypothetical protein
MSCDSPVGNEVIENLSSTEIQGQRLSAVTSVEADDFRCRHSAVLPAYRDAGMLPASY